MSLEAQIVTLNATITSLIAVMSGAKIAVPPSVSPSIDAAAKAFATPVAVSAAITLTYADVANVVTAYVKARGKDAAIAILKTHGLTRFTEAKDKPELFGPVKASFEAAAALPVA